MNLVVFKRGELEGGALRVVGQRARHLLGVVGVGVGSRLRVGEIGGASGWGMVTGIGSEEVIISQVELQQAPDRPYVDLILALPRPQMFKRILENAPGFMVRSIYLIGSERVEKSYFQSPVLQPEEIYARLHVGLEQAMTTHLPAVQVVEKFHLFINEQLEQLKAKSRFHLLAHNSAQMNIKEAACGKILKSAGVLLAIGPEGGWIEHEASVFQKHGFVAVSLGNMVLRVETAVYAALTQINMLAE